MGVELPAELSGLAAATGLSWPQADEDGLRAQAKAWRTAQRKLTALAGDADSTANGALDAMHGKAADAVRQQWAAFVHPDHGHLTTAARGAGHAADRLEHAADQVGVAKVEMARQLTDLAKHRDAAHAAAGAGHPWALLGLDTAVKATATNLAGLASGLTDAVGSGGLPLSTSVVVDPRPGARAEHGQGDLLSAVTGLPPATLTGAAPASDPGVPTTLSPVDRVASSVERLVPPAAHAVAGPAEGLVTPVTQAPVPPVDGSVPFEPGQAGAGTGPVRLPDPAGFAGPMHAAGHYGGLLGAQGFDNVPTPASGTPRADHTSAAGDAAPQAPPLPVDRTTASGYAGGAVPSAALPPSAPAPPGPLEPNPGFPPGPGGGAPGWPAGGGAPAPFVPPSPAAPPPSAGPPPGARWAPGQAYAGAAPVPPPRQAPPPPPPVPAPPQPLGSPRQERESVVALFLVHMFPLGHLPVASERPARQLPLPSVEHDYVSGLRFPLGDHPRGDLVDAGDALANVLAGFRRSAGPSATTAPAALSDGYDPLGGLHERAWDRRFYAGLRGDVPEYVWPPGELHPEGCHEPGDPVVLPEGTLLDRFGADTGRVFAAHATPFSQRSLPPAYLDGGYRRYRVLRDVPMWAGVSAPWFGQAGGGVRYRATHSAEELVTFGYLLDITGEAE